MEAGKNCPNCQADIGVWPVFSASLPTRIWCPHCSARLRYRDTRGVLLWQASLAIFIATIAAIAVFFVWPDQFANKNGLDLAIRSIVFCVATFGAWAPVELVSSYFLRNNKTLECIAKPSFEPTISSVCPMCGATLKPGVQACISCGENRTASQKAE